MAEKLNTTENQEWSMVISPNNNWFDLHLKDVWRYRDLLWLFVKRDFVSVYKQTILGPLWFIIQPILTTIMFVVVFKNVAKIPTDGIPPALFYLSGLTVWNYFASCITKTSNTFVGNAAIFGKVYFPRLIVPLSNVVSNLISFGIQFLLLIIMMIWYSFNGYDFRFNTYILVIPVIIILLAALGLGLGILISSLTTKYRDLTFLITFGVQLLMYATPVIYPLSFLSDKYRSIILANPLTPLVETFRYAVFSNGTFNGYHLAYSAVFTLFSLLAGIVIFNRVEKSFMDTV